MTYKKDNPPSAAVLLPRREFVGVEEYVSPINDYGIMEENTDPLLFDAAIELWNKTSGLSGLLQAKPIGDYIVKQQARTPASVYFDVVSGRWRYLISGYAVPYRRIAISVLRMSNKVQVELGQLTEKLVSGEISKKVWYDAMRRVIRDEYRAAFIAAIGGMDNYDKRMQQLFGQMVAPQYRWLNQFLDQLNTGKQPLNGFAVQRARMYARAANAIYQNTLWQVAVENGFRYARRRLGDTDQHCHDSASRKGCVELAGLGWVTITEVVPIGSASCYSHCLCTYEFRKYKPSTKKKRKKGK